MKKLFGPRKVEVTSPVDVNLSVDAYAYASCDENVVAAVGIISAAVTASIITLASAGVKKMKIKNSTPVKNAPKKVKKEEHSEEKED